MLFHPHGVQVVQTELGDSLDTDNEFAAEVGLFSLEVNGLVDLLGGKDVVADTDVVNEDGLKLIGLGTEDLVLLESLQIVNCQIADNWLLTLLFERHDFFGLLLALRVWFLLLRLLLRGCSLSLSFRFLLLLLLHFT